MNFLSSDIGFLHGRVHDLEHHWRDIHPNAVALNIRDDGLVRHIERVVGIEFDGLACGGDLDVLV